MTTVLDVVMMGLQRQQTAEKPSVKAIVVETYYSYELEIGLTQAQADKLGLTGEKPQVLVGTFWAEEVQATAFLWPEGRRGRVKVSEVLAVQLGLECGCDVTIRAA